jgi:hypothetical protein
VTDPEAVEDVASPLDIRLRFGRLSLDPHRIIYSTIMLMTAFALYDEGTAPLKTGAVVELIGVAIAPLFALAMAHAFSDALDLQIRNGRRLTRADRRHLLGVNLQYLYVAIPPIAIIIVLTIVGWDANDIVGLVELLGVASLFFWGAFAARKAHLGRGRQFTFGFNYALMGLLVILIELILTH